MMCKSYDMGRILRQVFEWADSTQVSRISQLTSFGSHEQIAEIIQMYSDEKAASRLAKKAMAAGVRFTPAEIEEMQIYVNKDCLNQMVKAALGDFAQEQVEGFCFSVDDSIYADLEKRYCRYEEDNEEDIEEPVEKVPKQKKSGKLFGLLAFAGMALDQGAQKNTQRFHVGEHVRVRWRGQEGTIIDINGGLYMVSMDDGRTVDSFPESDLEKAW